MENRTNSGAWETRRNISTFVLPDEEIDQLIENSSHAVVSWVTKSHEPVTAVMLYVIVNGLITVTSTNAAVLNSVACEDLTITSLAPTTQFNLNASFAALKVP